MKKPLRYWFWRLYVPTFSLVTTYLFIRVFQTGDLWYLSAAMCVFPFFFLVPILFINLLVFPFDYSIFGRYRRTPLPAEPPWAVIGSKFAWFTSWAFAGEEGAMGSVEWLAYPHGLGIKCGIYGNVFIPLTEIDAIDLERGFDESWYRWSSATIHHHCAEIRGPIYLSKRLAAMIAHAYPDKVLKQVEAA